jgi:uncharacterized protein (DUF2132 family)
MQQQSNDPLHGKTLEFIITTLVNEFGWEDLGQQIPIKCFNINPSIQSSLKFLRKTNISLKGALIINKKLNK